MAEAGLSRGESPTEVGPTEICGVRWGSSASLVRLKSELHKHVASECGVRIAGILTYIDLWGTSKHTASPRSSEGFGGPTASGGHRARALRGRTWRNGLSPTEVGPTDVCGGRIAGILTYEVTYELSRGPPGETRKWS